MSVHTLQVTDNGGVIIGANIAKGEAPETGRQILAFCYRINDEPVPLLLNRAPILPGQDFERGPIGDIGIRDGKVVIHTADCAACGSATTLRLHPDEADEVASHLATHASLARNAPDPAEVAALLGSIPPEVPPEVAHKTALWLAYRYEFTERTS